MPMIHLVLLSISLAAGTDRTPLSNGGFEKGLEPISDEAYINADKLGPRDYHIETPIVEAGKPACVIVGSGRRATYAPIAKNVQARIKRLTGVETTIVDAERVDTTDVLTGTNAIVLGNLVTSRFVETLYRQWYTLLDLWYPGRGGHVARTLHDPYGTSKNVIFLGGSDDGGVAEAAEAFYKALEQAAGNAPGRDLRVGRLMEIKLGDEHRMPPKGEWVEWRLRVFNPELSMPYGYTKASRAGLIYHYNGDEQAGKQFRRLALDTDVLTAADHYNMHMHALVWDLIEEAPIFSDQDRVKITQKLRCHARGKDGTAGIGRLAGYGSQRRLLDRHASMQAICTLTASRYFGKHWPSPEWDRNVKVVGAYFDRQMTTGKGDSDLGGRGIYSYFECALIPSLLLGDRRFIESGAMRHFAELCLMHCDNTGYMPDSGQSAHESYPTPAFRCVAALLGDGGFLSTMERRGEAERIGKFSDPANAFSAGQAWATGVAPKSMDKMIGVYHLPLTELEHEVRGKSIPIEKSLDKLTMRSGFGRDDQYLLLDGLHGGPGGKPFPDVNSIVNFGQNGRILLVSSVGGQNPVNHNVVTVCKDGYGAVAGKVASLEATADLPGFGYSHTRAADYVFSAWDRHIFWRKGGWFVVLDSLVVTDPGRYSFECQWRSVGEPAVIDSDFTSTVREWAKPDAPRDALRIKNAEKLPLRLSEQTSGLFGPPETKRWESYSRRKVINRLRQVADRTMKPGDEQVFTNLLYVGGDRTRADYRITKIGPHAAVITGSECAYVGLTEDGLFERGDMALHCQAFCVSTDRVAVVGATRIECPQTEIDLSAPCNVEMDLVSGQVTVQSTSEVSVVANEARHDLRAGTHEFSLQTHTDEFMIALAKQIKEESARSSRSTPKPTLKPTPAPKLPEMQSVWTFEAGAEVLSLHAGDIDGDGKTETFVGLRDGQAICLDASGKPRWEFKTGGPVRAIAHATVDAGPVVIIGSDDEHVYAITPDGNSVIWKHKCRLPDIVYTWWTTGMKATVRAILVDDLDGDGKAEIICGTGGGCIETVGGDGKLKWLRQIRWGIPDRLAVVPMPDGSKTLLVDNGYSSCGSTTWRLAADGRQLSGNACPTGRGAWDMTAIPGLKVVDLNGDGRPEVVIGRKGAYNEVGLYDAATGKRKWLHTLGDSADVLAALDVNGDGKAEVIAGSPSGWLCAFDPAGEQIWAKQMPHEIVAIVRADLCLLVACADAVAYRVKPNATISARYSMKGLPLRYGVAAGPHRILADRSGHVVALTP